MLLQWSRSDGPARYHHVLIVLHWFAFLFLLVARITQAEPTPVIRPQRKLPRKGSGGHLVKLIGWLITPCRAPQHNGVYTFAANLANTTHINSVQAQDSALQETCPANAGEFIDFLNVRFRMDHQSLK
jgi:heme A synthase